MTTSAESLKGIFWPAVFTICMGWLFWFFPRFIVLAGLGNDNLRSQNPPAGIVDWFFLIGMFVALILGVRSAKTTPGEGELRNGCDRVSLFLGRVTMLLIVLLVSVMFYEVLLRYVFERPTLWANELSLWMAGFIFLLTGLYAMQQRSHIRIYLLYDLFPRNVQRVCDVISTLLILTFAVMMIYGGWNEASEKFLRWETFGTAFDPPIPATLKPMILSIILLVAIQAIFNLIADWNKQAEHHAPIDELEVEEIIQSAREQHEQGRHD